MEQIADFHIHSRFSRACSRDLTIENLDKIGRVKGIHIIGTGDFTHPVWFKECETDLIETKTGSGLYRYVGAANEQVSFLLTSEVALIYKDLGRVRRLHLVLHAPSLEAVKQLNAVLDKRFNLKSDGRPILGISAPEFVKLCLSIHPHFLIYPAHIWTPWFSVFGSKSGFNSFEECFHEETPNIFAYETGLSSDPSMNWRVSALDKLTLLSSSDAHSLGNLGREANILNLQQITYAEIYKAIKGHDLDRIKGTIEFYPEEGMYHYDGHRDCGVSFAPNEFKNHHGICPVCHKPLVIGVATRVEELADRPEGFVLPRASAFTKLIELDKIIAQSLQLKSRTSVRVKKIYTHLVEELGDELSILRTVDLKKIEAVSGAHLAEAIRRMRAGKVTVRPGFDGQYGEIKVF